MAVPDSLAGMVERQDGVLSREQLSGCGFSPTKVRAAVAARRWQAFGRNVVVVHNGALTQRQRQWVAVLHPAKPAALAGLSAAQDAGLAGFEPTSVHIVVRHATHACPPAWVRLHESRRFSAADIAIGAGPPRTSVARALIDAAAWSSRPRRACTILCAGVQQRLVTASKLESELRAAGAVRHVAIMRSILG